PAPQAKLGAGQRMPRASALLDSQRASHMQPQCIELERSTRPWKTPASLSTSVGSRTATPLGTSADRQPRTGGRVGLLEQTPEVSWPHRRWRETRLVRLKSLV